MDYAEALQFVSGVEGGQDAVEAIKAEVSKKGAGEASVRQKLKQFDGIDPSKTKRVFDTLNNFGINIDDDIDNQLSNLNSKASDADTATSEMNRFKQKLAQIEKQLETERSEKAKLAQEKQRGDLFNALYPTFKDRVLNPKVALEHRIDRGDIVFDDLGKPALKNGDELISDNFIDSYLKLNPDESKVVQNGGGGSNPGNGGSVNSLTRDDLKQMTARQIAALPREQVQQAMTR